MKVGEYMTYECTIEKVRQDLFLMQDKKYAEFHSKLIPNIEKSLVIGVRTPLLRKYARKLYNTDSAKLFLSVLPHKYYEENNLHAFLLQNIKDIDNLLFEIDRFLPYIDNWATCDMLRPKILKKNKEKLLLKIREWLKSDSTYAVRFAIEMLMLHFLDEDFSEEYPLIVCNIKSNEYYVNMMRAWYFAEALAKRYDAVIPYFQDKKLDSWTHGKAIQKSVESFKISKEQKEYLKSMR